MAAPGDGIDRRSVTRYQRRAPDAGWLATLIVVPAAIALIGTMAAGPESTPPPLPAGPATATSADAMLAPLSLRRKGNDVIISGQLPDPASVAFAVDRIRTQLTGVTVLDQVTPIAGITAADLTGLDAVLAAGEPLSDFGFSIEGSQVVMYGAAQSEQARAALEEAVRGAWPNLEVVDDIVVTGS